MKNRIITFALSLATLFGAFTLSFANSDTKVTRVTAEVNSADTYWSSISESAISSGGKTLFDALNKKISSHSNVGYDGLYDSYKKTDAVPGTEGDNALFWDMYGGFAFDQGKTGNYKKEGDSYNREHSVPQSWWGTSSTMKADLGHVVPTDGYVNNRRGNYPFGEVDEETYSYSFVERRDSSGNVYQTAGISKLGTGKNIGDIKWPSDSERVFEPDDQYKGDFARITLYFATCYPGKAVSGNGSSTYTTSFPYLTDYGIALCKKWATQDPVSTKEINRNNAMQEEQGNRNPFIDHPEWVDLVWKSETPVVPTLQKIEVKNAKTEYTVGDAFVKPDVIATYDIGEPINVKESASFTGFDSSKAVETQTINVSYLDKTTSFTITIKDKDPGPGPEPTPVTPTKQGCGGNVLTTSIILSSIALTGVVLISLSKLYRKRKHEK